MALPTVKRIRNQVYHDLGIPPAAMENRDFHCTFDARDTQRALEGTGIAVPPLSTYAPRLWDYWERNLDPDLFRDRSLASAIKGKRILITGASSGIGLETAVKIGEAGGEVILVSRTREKLEEVAKQVEDAGGTAHVHPADLSDLDDIERMAAEVLEEHGGVDMLVNNAGRSIRRSVKALLRPLPRLRAHDAAQLLRRAEADPGVPARDARAQVGPHHQRLARSACRPTRRASRPTWRRSRRSTRSRAASAPEVVGDNVKFTTIYMPLVRTPMIAPTDIYKAFPTLSPEEAAQMLCDAMIDKPKRMASRLGTFGEVLYAISPKTVDIVLNTGLQPVPGLARPRRARRRSSRTGEARARSRTQEMSTEAVAMAYLMRGVHF